MDAPDNHEAGTPDRRPAARPDQPDAHEAAVPADGGVGTGRRGPTRAVVRERVVEVTAAALLAVVAVATAWSGYQAARWSGVQAAQYSVAAARRVEATRLATRAGQLVIYDLNLVNGWLDATQAGRQDLADVYRRRFREGFRPIFDAWLALDPFNNPAAPAGPTHMPEYQPALLAEADQREAEAARAFAAGQEANEISDQYVLNTVLLAVVLFCVTIAQGFEWAPVRRALLLVAAVALLYCLAQMAVSPIT
jgi:hypothetical protein